MRSRAAASAPRTHSNDCSAACSIAMALRSSFRWCAKALAAPPPAPPATISVGFAKKPSRAAPFPVGSFGDGAGAQNGEGAPPRFEPGRPFALRLPALRRRRARVARERRRQRRMQVLEQRASLARKGTRAARRRDAAGEDTFRPDSDKLLATAAAAAPASETLALADAPAARAARRARAAGGGGAVRTRSRAVARPPLRRCPRRAASTRRR